MSLWTNFSSPRLQAGPLIKQTVKFYTGCEVIKTLSKCEKSCFKATPLIIFYCLKVGKQTACQLENSSKSILVWSFVLLPVAPLARKKRHHEEK